MKKCRLVMIEWEDSAQPISSWSFLSDFSPGEIVKCASVGWLIHDGKDLKALAPNMGNMQDEGGIQASGIIRIPTCCVKRIVKLKEKQ